MQNIHTFEVRFSTVPVGDMDVKIPLSLDVKGALFDAHWVDINCFIEDRKLRLIQVVTYEQGQFERPKYIGIFEES